MKRRAFLRTIGAATISPLLPAPSLAGSVAVPINEFQMGWVTMFARAQNLASPAHIKNWLRISERDAQQVMAELVRRGVVTSPVAGASQAVAPLYPGGKPPGFIAKSKSIAEKTSEFLRNLDDTSETILENDDASVEIMDVDAGETLTEVDLIETPERDK